MVEYREVRQYLNPGQALADLRRVDREAEQTVRAGVEGLIARINHDYAQRVLRHERIRLERRRRRFGGNRVDAGHDLWLSSACSAWLHESCPDDGTLRCSCACHQREG